MNVKIKDSETIGTNKMSSDKKVLKITLTAIFATLITIMTAYICHIPVPASGGYIHIGDSMIYLAASVLSKPYAMFAAAIGGAMADLLTAPMWAIPTFIIKALIVIPFTKKGTKILCKKNIIATIIAYLISSTGYYLANKFLFGSGIAYLTSIGSSFIQSGGSAIVYILMASALDKANIKNRLFKS